MRLNRVHEECGRIAADREAEVWAVCMAPADLK